MQYGNKNTVLFFSPNWGVRKIWMLGSQYGFKPKLMRTDCRIVGKNSSGGIFSPAKKLRRSRMFPRAGRNGELRKA